MSRTILLLGKNGQVGFELARSLRTLGHVVALGRSECDMSNELQLRDVVARTRPAVIVNAAAYTLVDLAEQDVAVAECVNATAVGVLAELANASGAVLVHYSSDYVYAGDKTGPYVESDATGPTSVYGRTKLAGDALIRAHCSRHFIFRTSWVFGAHGQNFLKTMLALMKTRRSLRVVADQCGAPTSAALIADVTVQVLAAALAHTKAASVPFGTYHLTASGSTTWHAYARRLATVALGLGVPLETAPDAIEAVSTEDFPLPARRPANSRLDTSKLERTFDLTLPPWEHDVDAVLRSLIL